jgi:hypothetical protein
MESILGTTIDGSFEIWEVFCKDDVLIGRKMLSAITEDFSQFRQLNSPFAKKLSFDNEAVATTFDVLIEQNNVSVEAPG